MKEKAFYKKMDFESNTYYKVNEKELNYCKEDTISLDNIEYFCSTTKYSNFHDNALTYLK